MQFIILLASFVAPGFGHGLLGRPREMAIVLGGFALAGVLTAFTIYALVLMPLVIIGAAIHALLLYRKLRPNIRYDAANAIVSFVVMIGIAFALRATVIEAFKIPSSAMYPTLQIGDHLFIDKLSPRWRSPDRGDIIVFRQPCQPDRDYIKRIIGLPNDTIEVRCNVVYINGTAVPHTLVTPSETYQDHDDYQDQWFSRDVSRYHEELGSHSFDVFEDPEAPARDQRQQRKELTAGDPKDFPLDRTIRSCSSDMNPDSRASTDQAPGTIEGNDTVEDPCKPHLHYIVPPDHVFVMGDCRHNSNDSRYWGSVPISYIKGFARGIWSPFGRFGPIP